MFIISAISDNFGALLRASKFCFLSVKKQTNKKLYWHSYMMTVLLLYHDAFSLCVYILMPNILSANIAINLGSALMW